MKSIEEIESPAYKVFGFEDFETFKKCALNCKHEVLKILEKHHKNHDAGKIIEIAKLQYPYPVILWVLAQSIKQLSDNNIIKQTLCTPYSKDQL